IPTTAVLSGGVAPIVLLSKKIYSVGVIPKVVVSLVFS
ncbi:unnamed protein product, partial [Brassica oleracea var. botrytis]